MIDVRKIKSKRSPVASPRVWLETRDISLVLVSRDAFDLREGIDDLDRVEHKMRLRLWSQIYGDLWKPLVEAQAMLETIKYAGGIARGRTGFEEHLEEICRLLAEMRRLLRKPGDESEPVT